MPLLVCHIGWMANYEGLEQKPDRIARGGSWIDKHGYGGEVCNFLRCKDGNVYGHVETIKGKKDRPIHIRHLGANKDDPLLDGVDIVWTSTNPQKGGRKVVGWYRNARVYRGRQAFASFPSTQHRLDELEDYRIVARADDVTLIPLHERAFSLGRGKGWIGQANWWFPDQSANPEVKSFIRDVTAMMGGGVLARLRRPGHRWGGLVDPERKAAVESAAIDAVERHFSEYEIKSVEKENLGWDLEASRDGRTELHLEVKGLFSNELKIGLTPREYEALKRHSTGEMPTYRLCVLTGALTMKPRLTVFRFDRGQKTWVDDFSGRLILPEIKPLEAAIVSLC